MNEQPKCIRADDPRWHGECEGAVTLAPDPFMHEIHGDETLVWQCNKHRHDSAWEI